MEEELYQDLSCPTCNNSQRVVSSDSGLSHIGTFKRAVLSEWECECFTIRDSLRSRDSSLV